jgi:hypothetical protein
MSRDGRSSKGRRGVSGTAAGSDSAARYPIAAGGRVGSGQALGEARAIHVGEQGPHHGRVFHNGDDPQPTKGPSLCSG